jgi:hypothetical protein
MDIEKRKKYMKEKRCYHYTNLMPRFATTEIAKSFGCNQIGNLNKRNKKVEK